MKKQLFLAKTSFRSFLANFFQFSHFLALFLNKKLVSLSHVFESSKNSLVKVFMTKRGRYNRIFLHMSTMGVLGIGVILAPFLANNFPVFSQEEETFIKLAQSEMKQSIIIDENVFQTEVSQKPRDKVIDYKVQKGDTVSTIARKFGISEDTIRWANALSNDNLAIGDALKILPVSGVWHRVNSGDTVYSIAKKYDSNPQQMVDFPFNEFANPETFSLISGQMILVPDGIKPDETPSSPRTPSYNRPAYIAQNPSAASSAGFAWPLRGGISQYASWYHNAIDITSSVGTPMVAARSGTVVRASTGTWDGGYGNSVTIDHGNGYQTHYAHMARVYVGAGSSVVGGKTVIGTIGMTGRTTGPHLHFEIRRNGALVNPLSYL